MGRVCMASSSSALPTPSPQDPKHVGTDHGLLRWEAPWAVVPRAGFSGKLLHSCLIRFFEAYSWPRGRRRRWIHLPSPCSQAAACDLCPFCREIK